MTTRSFQSLAAALAMCCLGLPTQAVGQRLEVDGPQVFLKGIPFTITVTAPERLDTVEVVVTNAMGEPVASGSIAPFGQAILGDLRVEYSAALPLTVTAGEVSQSIDRPVLPGWFSILPPILAIVLALVFREVITSLFAGVLLGAWFVAGFNPIEGLKLTIDTFIRGSLADPNNAAIVLFTLLLGGMVGVMSRMGGTQGLVETVTPYATSRRRGLFATWIAGLAIFFDDYANTLLVGNTMRPLTDRLKISREKLAYIVDSTAAPVTVVVFVSTWVGYEIGLIGGALTQTATQYADNPALQAELLDTSPFAVFLQTVPYLFYPILAVFAVALFIWSGRDFGPMLEAERRALSGGGLYRPGAQLAADTGAELAAPPEGTRLRWWNGALPILVVIGVVLAGLWWTGKLALAEDQAATLSNIIGGADPFKSLLWASLAGSATAVLLAVSQRIVPLPDAMGAWIGGIRAMMIAMVILVLAWSLGAVTTAINTAPFLTTLLSDRLPIELLPVTTFLIAAAISFATGTSWGTMAILLPLVVPLAIALDGGQAFAAGGNYAILLGGIASVMAGSIFGDHCSPISDTTVLSSMASGCDHVDHVRTQLPYALMVGGVGIVVGSVPTAFGMSPWISLPLGMVVIWTIVRFVGRRPEAA